MPAPEWKQLTDGSYKGFTFAVALPKKDKGHGLRSKETTHERKLQIVDRPLVDGSGTNDFGRKGRVFSAEIIFHGNNYNTDFQAFLKILNQGTPGVLTLPDEPQSVNASYQRMSEKTQVGESNSKSVNITWVESDETAAVFVDSKVAGPKSILESAAASKGFLAAAAAAVNNNPILAAIRTAESGLSTVRSAVNAVTSLVAGVKNRIAQIDAEVRGTIGQIIDAINTITNLLGATSSTQTSTFSAAIDPITGQRTADFSEPDQVTPQVSPLANTQNAPTTAITIGAILSPAAALSAINALSAVLQADRDSLVELTSGRTGDVHVALTAVLSSLQDFKTSIQATSTMQVVVPMEMSLMEILFQNGKTIDQVDDVYRQNRQITDPLVVSAGTVINL